MMLHLQVLLKLSFDDVPPMPSKLKDGQQLKSPMTDKQRNVSPTEGNSKRVSLAIAAVDNQLIMSENTATKSRPSNTTPTYAFPPSTICGVHDTLS